MGITSDLVYEQASTVAYRLVDNRLHIYLITSLKKKKWILPKGIVEGGFTPVETAIIESYEESGLIGLVDPHPLGEYRLNKWKEESIVTVFPMKVLCEMERWPEMHARKRMLLDYHRGSWREIVQDPHILHILEHIDVDTLVL